MASLIHLRLLGAVDLSGFDGAPGFLSQTKRVALLAYLAAAEPYGYHTRDRIAALFWPEVDQDSARAALRKAVHAVREALGKEAILGRGDEELALNRELVWCDVPALQEAGAGGQLARVLELYRGPLMPGFFADAPGFEQWLDERREQLRLEALGHALQFLEQLERESNYTVGTQFVRKILRLVAFEERIVRKLMAFLERAGARSDALKVYDDFARKVKAELQSEPDAETRALAERLRRA